MHLTTWKVPADGLVLNILNKIAALSTNSVKMELKKQNLLILNAHSLWARILQKNIQI